MQWVIWGSALECGIKEISDVAEKSTTENMYECDIKLDPV